MWLKAFVCLWLVPTSGLMWLKAVGCLWSVPTSGLVWLMVGCLVG